jgi:hypothetical protein
MRDRIAGPRATGKPLQIAVDSVPGTTGRLNRAIGGGSDQARNMAGIMVFRTKDGFTAARIGG